MSGKDTANNDTEGKVVQLPTPKKKKRKATFENVEKFMNENYHFRYNEIANDIEVCRINSGNGEAKHEPLNENTLYRHLQHNGLQISMSNLMYLLRSDYVTLYNPFIDYFTTLPKWDGTDHIDNLANYVTAADQVRFNNHLKKMLVRSIACALGTTINRHAFIIVGQEQQKGKTYFLRWLCPPELKKYYNENISTDKDSLISLCENFIINLDELAGLQRFEITALKHLLSKDVVKVRKPYDRKPTLTPRRANFVGSTNKEELLSDETGNTRWLCFTIQEINWDYSIAIDIQQVWAQAFHLYKTGYGYHLTADDLAENEKANQEHFVLTPEMELIQKYYAHGTKEDNDAFMTATEILSDLIGKTMIKLTPVNVGKALTYLKHNRVSVKVAGAGKYGYYIKNI